MASSYKRYDVKRVAFVCIIMQTCVICVKLVINRGETFPFMWIQCVIHKHCHLKPSLHSSVGRASDWSHTVSGGMIGPSFKPHQWLLATKRSADVAPEVNLRECVICTPLPSTNKAAHSGFKTQRKYHQKSKTWVSAAQQKDLCPPEHCHVCLWN